MAQSIGDIRDRVRRHNRAMWMQAAGCAVAFPLLLALSFGLLWWLVSMGLMFWLGPTRAMRIAAIVAAAAAVALVIEAIRLVISDRQATPDTSITNWDQLVSSADSYAAYRILGGLAAARVITEVIFCAPRALARAIRAWRRVVRPDESDINAMRQVIARLEAAKGWLPVESFAAHVRAIVMLQTMNLVWLKPRGDEVAIRINPSFCP